MKPDPTIWFRVSRANFLLASLLPFAAGSVYAARSASFGWGRFALGLAGAALVHLAANLLNEYWDYRMGADLPGGDCRPHSGGSGVLPGELIAPDSVRAAAGLCLAAAFFIGVVLSWRLRTPVVGGLGFLGASIAWAYTAPPLRLAYRGWGEAALFTAFGPLLVGGGYYLQALRFSSGAALLAVAAGFQIAGLLLAHEGADADSDARALKRNLAVRLGGRKAWGLVAACLLGAYGTVGAGVALGRFPLSALAVFLALPVSLAALAALARALGGRGDFRVSSARAMVSHHVFLIALILGLLP